MSLLARMKKSSLRMDVPDRCSLKQQSVLQRLLLSEGNRTVTSVQDEQPYPDHPDRFVHWHNVLSREPLVGRCY